MLYREQDRNILSNVSTLPNFVTVCNNPTCHEDAEPLVPGLHRGIIPRPGLNYAISSFPNQRRHLFYSYMEPLLNRSQDGMGRDVFGDDHINTWSQRRTEKYPSAVPELICIQCVISREGYFNYCLVKILFISSAESTTLLLSLKHFQIP